MIRIAQLKLRVDHTEEELAAAIQKKAFGNPPIKWKIVKRSIDARKKPELYYIYTVDATFASEKKILHHKNSKWSSAKTTTYHFPCVNKKKLKSHERPVIIGLGPAGLFAGLILARNGFAPVIFERGDSVDERTRKVEQFFRDGILDEESNVQFGEGGAGTFSDGKLNTLVKDKCGRNRFVLEEFVRHGAPEEILFDAKPHIGTDVLKNVVASIREEILTLGGEIHFGAKVTELLTAESSRETCNCGDKVTKAAKPVPEVFREPLSDCGDKATKDVKRMGTDFFSQTSDCGNKETKVVGLRVEIRNRGQITPLEWPCENVILAIGHSSRDTFTMLFEKKTIMTPKAFAIGLRVEHPAEMINESQYGKDYPAMLPTANYKLTHSCGNGRNVYSFCMCPGGYVVNSSSEKERLCVNGMSYSKRNAANSNSAIITTVIPEDFGSAHPLAGMEFQRKYESLAYQAGQGNIPVQLYGDLMAGRISSGFGSFNPCIKGKWSFADLRTCLPSYVMDSFLEGMEHFGHQIQGYDREDTILSGVETRMSSPVRIERDSSGQSNIKGLFPCGEGAGYAGGITSAAMDGLRVAESVVVLLDA